jgi:hypothetical protein
VDDIAAYAGDVLDCAPWFAGMRYADYTTAARGVRCHLVQVGRGVYGRTFFRDGTTLGLIADAGDADGAG